MTEKQKSKPHPHPIRAALMRGLAVVLPPLLTVVIFLWIGATVGQYAIEPLHSLARGAIVWAIADIPPQESIPESERASAQIVLNGKDYARTPDGHFVPQKIYDDVHAASKKQPMPETAVDVYNRYVELQYLQPWVAIPGFVCLFILMLYLLGKFMAAGVGHFSWRMFERGIHQVPLVRNVYGAVKQISDFILAQDQIEFSRVVAVEWPRKGIWTVALVTGESLPDIAAAANEPVVSVLIPTSPMPMTGFTVNVRKSEVIDLDLSFDQAIQFIVSCGVAVPRSEVQRLAGPSVAMSESARRLLADSNDNADSDSDHPSPTSSVPS